MAPSRSPLDLAVDLIDDLKPYPGKACGGCTACCRSVPVKEIALPAFTPCPHLRSLPELPGCSIYAKRPASCRMWSCGWLAADWGDDLRPDRCGVVVDPMEDLVWINGDEVPVVRLWVLRGHEEDWCRDPARTLILALIDAGMGVIWDMAPTPAGERLARVFRRYKGRLEVGPPTLATPDVGMGEAERYFRAREASSQTGPGRFANRGTK